MLRTVIGLLFLLCGPSFVLSASIEQKYIPSAQCDQGAPGGAYSYGGYVYRLTDEVMSPVSLGRDIINRFQGKAELVTWSELKPVLSDLTRRMEFIARLKIPLQFDNYDCGNVLLQPLKTENGTIPIFIAYHEGVIRSDWKSLDEVGGHQLDIGSWSHSGRALIREKQLPDVGEIVANRTSASKVPTQKIENTNWSVSSQDVNDDDSDLSCLLNSGGSFRFGVSADKKTARIELQVPPNFKNRTSEDYYDVGLALDDGPWQTLQAIYIAETNVVSIAVSDPLKLLENLKRSRVMRFMGDGITRKIPVGNAGNSIQKFRQCLNRGSHSEVAQIQGTIPYGSRAGMDVSVMSSTGINTSHAEFLVKHTRENAQKFCQEYVLDKSEKCIDQAMADIKVSDRITANCLNGEFSDALGERYRFEGQNKDPDVMADFRIRRLSDNQILDGSSASGYGTEATVLASLCPKMMKPQSGNKAAVMSVPALAPSSQVDRSKTALDSARQENQPSAPSANSDHAIARLNLTVRYGNYMLAKACSESGIDFTGIQVAGMEKALKTYVEATNFSKQERDELWGYARTLNPIDPINYDRCDRVKSRISEYFPDVFPDEYKINPF